jgi:hypothetical protein
VLRAIDEGEESVAVKIGRNGTTTTNHLTHRSSQPLAVMKSTFDFMKQSRMFAKLAPAQRWLSSVSLGRALFSLRRDRRNVSGDL